MNGGTCCCYEGDVSRCPIHRRDDVKVIDVAAARCAQVEASRKELQDWKESALLIFREWDKVAKVVLKNGGKLGESMAGESIRVFKELEAAKVAAESEVTKLREALRKFGKHEMTCLGTYEAKGPCDCGLEQAREGDNGPK